ncbi:MAG: hypothetical protein ISQ14_13745 [Verrucomicrobiae bacterium]|nr:hypothetical protein [Verrucomicrobiae bacterium]
MPENFRTLAGQCPTPGGSLARVNINVSNWKASKGVKHIWNAGMATLYRMNDGRFELHGGSRRDRLEALEMASLFHHEAVFDPTCPTKHPERN